MVKSKRTCNPGEECWEEQVTPPPAIVKNPNEQRVLFNTDKGDIIKVQDIKQKNYWVRES